MKILSSFYLVSPVITLRPVLVLRTVFGARLDPLLVTLPALDGGALRLVAIPSSAARTLATVNAETRRFDLRGAGVDEIGGDNSKAVGPKTIVFFVVSVVFVTNILAFRPATGAIAIFSNSKNNFLNSPPQPPHRRRVFSRPLHDRFCHMSLWRNFHKLNAEFRLRCVSLTPQKGLLPGRYTRFFAPVSFLTPLCGRLAPDFFHNRFGVDSFSCFTIFLFRKLMHLKKNKTKL